MSDPLTKPDDRRARQVEIYERTHGPEPDCYLAQAEWWRIDAEESATPDASLQYAKNLEAKWRTAIERAAGIG